MKEQMIDAVNSLVELTEDTLEAGFSFEDCFPATTYKIITYKGHEYTIAMSIRLIEA